MEWALYVPSDKMYKLYPKLEVLHVTNIVFIPLLVDDVGITMMHYN